MCAGMVSVILLHARDINVPLRNKDRVSVWEATHWRRARALQTRFEAAAVS